MTQTATRRTSKSPRGLWLSTGESVWAETVSMAARTIIVWIKRGDVDAERLAEVQTLADQGDGALVGGTFIAWLAEQSLMGVRERIITVRESAMKMINATHIAESHKRPVQSLANVFVAYRLVADFVKDKMPDIADVVLEAGREAFRDLTVSVERETKEAELLSPFNSVIEAILAEMSVDRIQLAARFAKLPGTSESPFARVVGWFDAENLYFNETVTLGWYLEHKQKQGNKPLTNWQSFCNEASVRFGAQKSTSIYPNSTPVRVLAVPLNAVAELKDRILGTNTNSNLQPYPEV